jgi:mannitol-1-/sugar-/sorbitol-6-phosphatase
VLFDLDGTLVDSRVSVDRHWRRWARRHGLEQREVLPFVYGHRSIDTVRHFLPHVDPAAEARRVDAEQAADVADVRAIETAPDLLRALPRGRWAIVTSATRSIATARLDAAGLPFPPVLVCAEDVERGKPSPDAYLAAAAELAVAPADCVVVEDTPSGIEAARAAGMFTVAVPTTHTTDQLARAQAVIAVLEDLTPLLHHLWAERNSKHAGTFTR